MSTLSTSAASRTSLTRAGAFFMLLPALLLGLGVIGWIVMIRAAVGDPSAAIEPDYYRQATNIDREKALLARSDELGWSAKVETFVVQPGGSAKLALRITERSGAAVSDLSVSVVAFHNSRSGDRQALHLAASDDGTYSAEVAGARPGLWELRVSADRAGEAFRVTLRTDLTRNPSH